MAWLKNLKELTKGGKAGSGPLTGKTVKVQSYLVRVENVLGEGGFATIYRCSDNTTKAAFALKHFRLSGHPEAVRDVQTEVGVMKALRECPYVLHVRAVAFSGPAGAEDEAFVLLDLCKDNLFSFLAARNFALDDYSVLRAFLPVCRAVQAMHSLDPPLTHRDLKAENVLLHTNGQWVLCDFGSATSAQQVYSNPREIALEEENIRKHTTPAYRAPEMWDLYAREFIGLKVDIWALGCLLYLLCFGRLPFDGDAKLQILNGRYSMPPSRPEALRSLIKDMLVVDQKQRVGIDEVVRRLEELAPPELSRPLPAAVPAFYPASPPLAVSPSQGSLSQEGTSTPPLAPAAAPPAAAATAAPANTAAPPRSSGSFWQDQAAAPAAQQPEEGGWASFGSPPKEPTPAAKLYPTVGPAASSAAPAPSPPPSEGPRPGSSGAKLYPTVGAPSPGPAAQDVGSKQGDGESSWASFGSPTHAGRSGAGAATVSRPNSSSAGSAAAVPSGTPPPQAPPAVMEGPLSAGFRVLAASSPFSVGAAPGRGTPPPGQGAGAPASEVTPPPRPTAQQPQSRPGTSELVGHPAISPIHSRESSRTGDTLSRTSGSMLGVEDLAASAPARSEDGLTEAEQLQLRASQLEEHCRVLEQLLEEKTSEVMSLREENARQAREIQQLRQQAQQAQQREQAARASSPLPRSGSLGNAANAGQLKVEVQPADGFHDSSAWVAFGGSGPLEDAPTPTILKPPGSSKQAFPPVPSPLEHQQPAQQQRTPLAAGAVPAGGAAGTAAAQPSPATPLDELLGAKLDLGSAAGTAQQGHTPPLAKSPLGGTSSSSLHVRAGSGSFSVGGSAGGLEAGAGSGGWDRQLPFQEFNPLAAGSDGEGPKPLRRQDTGKSGGGHSGASSVQPSPAKPLSSLGLDGSGSGLGTSPLKTRPSGGAAAAASQQGGSPLKVGGGRGGGHRRQASETFFHESKSQKLFGDLNPLG